jgi:YfiH family protein
MQDIIQFSHFSQFPNLIHGFSTRKLGSIKERAIVFEDNLAKFADALHIDPKQVVFTKQVHGKAVAIVSQESDRLIPDTDGLITRDRGVFIGMATADCLPIIFYSPIHQIVGVVHAGYKGILAGILEHQIRTMIKLGADAEDIHVGIGPAIDVCCYNVPKERVDAFTSQYPFLQNHFLRKEQQYFLDLKQIASAIVQKEGILNSHIAISSFCTQSSLDTFFSFRGDSKETFGEFATIIGMV